MNGASVHYISVCYTPPVSYQSWTLGRRHGLEDKKNISTTSKHSGIQQPDESLEPSVPHQSCQWNWKHHNHQLPSDFSKPAENTNFEPRLTLNIIAYGCEPQEHFHQSLVQELRWISNNRTGTKPTINTLSFGGSTTPFPT